MESGKANAPARTYIDINDYSYEGEDEVLRRQYIITSKIGLFSLLVGTMHSWTSGIKDELESGAFGFTLTHMEYIYLSALLPLGAILSALPVAIIALKFGCKITLQILLAPSFLSWILLAAAQNVYMFFVGRFLSGLAVGGYKTLITIYIMEITQTKRRGLFCCMGYELFLSFGILYDQLLVTRFGAMICTYLCLVLPIAAFGVSFFLPETPYNYMKKHDAEGCKSALKALRGEEYDITNDYVEIYDNYKRYLAKKRSVFQILAKRMTKKSLILSFSMIFFQQFSGINAVLFYMHPMFKLTQIEFNLQYAMLGILMMQSIGVLMAVVTVDHIGRRLLLLISEFSVSLTAFGIAIYYYMNKVHPEAAKVLTWVPIACTTVYIVFFSIGLGAVTWLIVSELIPFSVRYIASAIVNIFQSLLTFVIVTLFNYLVKTISVFFLFTTFSVISLFGFFFILLWVPETRNRTFLEIYAALHHKRFSKK